MVNPGSVGAAIIRWAAAEPTVSGLVLIGSQVHAGHSGVMAADGYSDWDFHIITTRPVMFAEKSWLKATGLGEPLAYVARVGRLGVANKVSAVLPAGELDLVVIPAHRLALVQWLMRFGFRRALQSRKDLGGLALVLRAGHRIIKGEAQWGALMRRIATDVSPLRLDDEGIRFLAEGFVSDYVSTLRKIARGELIAAQRWLHGNLAETNFRLAHELSQRNGQVSFPDARRLEALADTEMRESLKVEATMNSESLTAATNKSAETCRALVQMLVGDSWRWPDLPTPAP